MIEGAVMLLTDERLMGESGEYTAAGRAASAGAVQVRVFPDGIGYLRVTHFDAIPIGARKLGDAFARLAHTEALIIDLCENSGGDAATCALMMSLLFDTEPVHLQETYAVRLPNGSVTPGVRYLDRPVIVVVSRSSSLIAWQCARALHRNGRAVVAGDLPEAAQGELIPLVRSAVSPPVSRRLAS
jgi:C-terminal processing protease CtpA/Prc